METRIAKREPAAVEDAKAALLRRWFERKSPKTVEAYKSDLEAFRSFVGAENGAAAVDRLITVDSATANGLALDFLADMKGKGLSPATINRRLSALKSLVSLARRTVPGCNAILDVEGEKREPRRNVEGPDMDSVVGVLSTLRRSRKARDVRDYAALSVLATMGLRRAELLGLKREDVGTGTLAVLRKGYSEKQTLEVPRETEKALRRWMARSEGDVIFNLDPGSLFRMVRRRGLRRPHGLRHTAITEAIAIADRKGLSRATVADFSGHTSPAMLEHYNDAREKRQRQGMFAGLLAKRFLQAVPA